jgi:hypothetical protein
MGNPFARFPVALFLLAVRPAFATNLEQYFSGVDLKPGLPCRSVAEILSAALPKARDFDELLYQPVEFRPVRVMTPQGMESLTFASPNWRYAPGLTEENRFFFVKERRPVGEFSFGTEYLDHLTPRNRLRRELDAHLRLVYRKFLERGIHTQEEIEEFIRLEHSLPTHRVYYSVFVDPGTQEARAVVRLFDGSPTPVRRAGKGERVTILDDAADRRLPLEREFPHLILPERVSEGDQAALYEIGRLGVDGGEVEDAVPALLRRLTEASQANRPSAFDLPPSALARVDSRPERPGVLYLTATPGAAQLYLRRYGLEARGMRIVFTPEDLKLKPGQPPRVVLRMPIRDFHQAFPEDRRIIPRLKRPGG